ncbi:hypothetical protein OF001_U50026 [Pseudomonas sp. OF001]|nr:hypothetical protein OF001_U50026 [Pseudomonas sp. OF001]
MPAVVRRTQPGGGILRGQVRRRAVGRPELRPARATERPGQRAVRARLGLRQGPAGQPSRLCPGGVCARRGATGRFRPGPGRRHRLRAAGQRRLPGPPAHRPGHAVLRSRDGPADGAVPGRAPRGGGRPAAAGAFQSPPVRPGPGAAAAHAGRCRGAHLAGAGDDARQAGGVRRDAGAERLRQLRQPQPVPQLRADGRLPPRRGRAPLRRLVRTGEGRRQPLRRQPAGAAARRGRGRLAVAGVAVVSRSIRGEGGGEGGGQVRTRWPTIFVPSRGGISHNPREHAADDQSLRGVQVLPRVVARRLRQ